MNQLFVIGDVHGKLDMLNKLLTCWNSSTQKLVFVGDYIDRGPDSLGVVLKVKELTEKYGAIALGGNHERMFLDWLDYPEDYWFVKWLEDESIVNYYEQAGYSSSINYYYNGGIKTIDSFCDGNVAFKYLPTRNSKFIKDNYEREIEFIRNLPDYYEWKDYVCVHAGVNLNLLDWKKSGENDFRWIREIFHYGKNETGKKFLFGHTPTRNLNKNSSNDIWMSNCKTKIGIDGGAVFKGLLHGVAIEDNVLTINSVDNDLFVSKQTVLI
ncbi:Serine/threonine-protein phosphatase 1 [compost metagenome]